MSRSVPEWIAKHPDEKIPPRVRLRIWEKHHGICHLTGRKIHVGDKWEMDHIVALVNGGQHRESNLAPALVDAHREKTREDVAEKSAVRKVALKHIGERKSQMKGRGFAKKEKVRYRSSAELARMGLYPLNAQPGRGED